MQLRETIDKPSKSYSQKLASYVLFRIYKAFTSVIHI